SQAATPEAQCSRRLCFLLVQSFAIGTCRMIFDEQPRVVVVHTPGFEFAGVSLLCYYCRNVVRY
ncbi:MAG: hypothetical protein KDH90_18610, partial [Anaerolineae bacterium]|nr:hypothetical protein [Anaerolineae bacterium]